MKLLNKRIGNIIEAKFKGDLKAKIAKRCGSTDRVSIRVGVTEEVLAVPDTKREIVHKIVCDARNYIYKTHNSFIPSF